MARFYFHLHERNGVTLDDEGLDLADWDVARGKGIEAARSIMSHDVLRGRLSLDGHIEILCAGDDARLRLAFRDVLHVSG